jgi:hypothetical protein
MSKTVTPKSEEESLCPRLRADFSAVGRLIGKDAGGLRIVSLARDLRQERPEVVSDVRCRCQKDINANEDGLSYREQKEK